MRLSFGTYCLIAQKAQLMTSPTKLFESYITTPIPRPTQFHHLQVIVLSGFFSIETSRRTFRNKIQILVRKELLLFETLLKSFFRTVQILKVWVHYRYHDFRRISFDQRFEIESKSQFWWNSFSSLRNSDKIILFDRTIKLRIINMMIFGEHFDT